MPDRPPGDPRELLRLWMEWEEGTTTPGKVMSDLKRGGLRELLENVAEAVLGAESGAEPPGSAPKTAAET